MTKSKIKTLSYWTFDSRDADEYVNKWIEKNNVSIIDIKFQKNGRQYDFMIHYVSTFKKELLTEKYKNDKT